MEQLEAGEEAIQLTHSQFTIQGFSSFARELRDVETVESLFLRSNQLTDEMAAELAEALKRNRSIKELLYVNILPYYEYPTLLLAPD